MPPKEIKSYWQSAKESITDSNYTPDFHKRTSLESLCLRYKRFAILALFFAVSSPLVFKHTFNEIISSEYRIINQSVYIAILLICGLNSFYLYRNLRRINPTTMSVEETLSAILRCRRQHLIFVAVALPVTIGWIIFTACISSDMAIITGIVTGALVGLALGVVVLMRFLEDYKDATNL